MKKLLISAILVMNITMISGQTKEDIDKAAELGKQAVQLMDNGEFEESLQLLQEAKSLDPENISYPYEVAYAHYMMKDFETAIGLMKKLIDHPQVYDQIYQFLGNMHDITGNPDKAIEIYHQGMKKFPKSGKCYLEAGIVEIRREDYDKAVEYWENGILVDPYYSSNYYWLAKTFAMTDEKIWTLIYGEMFMNMEPGSSRTEEISKLIYKTYQEGVKKNSDSTFSINYTKKGFHIELSGKKDLKKIKRSGLPFEGSFDVVFTMAAVSHLDPFDPTGIVKARTNFIGIWMDKHDKNYPHPLFQFHQSILEAGHFETYSYWLISRADHEFFDTWYDNNEEEFNAFAEWFKANSIELTKKDKYRRIDL